MHELVRISDFLRSQGETIVSNWIYKDVQIPFSSNLTASQRFSTEITNDLLAADVFVVINDKGGTDLFTEYGFCLSRKLRGENIKLYVVGKIADASLLQLHPSVVHVEQLHEVFEAEHISLNGFILPRFE